MCRLVTGDGHKVGLVSKVHNDTGALLGCYTSYIDSWSPMFRENLSVPYLRVTQVFLSLEEGIARLPRNIGN